MFYPGTPFLANANTIHTDVGQESAGVDITLQTEYADDGTTPEGGVNAARKLISKGADCILGALTSGSSIAIAQAATVPAQVPQIGPNNSSPALTDLKDNGYYFRTMPSDTLQAPILARLLTLASLTGVSDLLSGEGLWLDRLEAPFTLRDHELLLE